MDTIKLVSTFTICFLLSACSSVQSTSNNAIFIPVYAWNRGFNNPSEEVLQARFIDLKDKGVSGIIYSAGKNPQRYKRAGRIAKELGLTFYALLPAMMQHKSSKLDQQVYMVNGLGESTYDQPSFPNNHFVCPSRPAVYSYLEAMYAKIADLPEVDGIQLDVIRFPDVILAPALWEKYKLTMDKEYPKYDYCYCDKCTLDFKVATGIDIKTIEEPSELAEWKQFRYDLITNTVNKLAAMVHAKNKKITAAVFAGPNSVAKKIVRQEWNKWEVDAFFPMNYNDFYLEDTEWIGEVCKEAVLAVEDSKPIYSGLFICPNPENKTNEKDPEYFGLLPEELGEAIQASMSNGATGICLFTSGRMTPAHWDALRRFNKKDQ